MKTKRQHSPHVLVVEDEDGLSIRTTMLLRKVGYQVSSAHDGAEALDRLTQADRLPSVILLDLLMPVMDGWRFREIQRRHPRLRHIPVIVVADAPVNEEYASVLDADEILVKPFERGDLLRALARSAAGFRAKTASLRQDPVSFATLT